MALPETLSFGDFTLEVDERRLSKGTGAVRLSPKAYDVLVALVRRAGSLVTKRELLDEVWQNAFVEEGILAVHVSHLRKALGDAERHPIYIETVSRSGYRFIAAVTAVSSDGEPTIPRAAVRPLEASELLGRGRTHLLSGSFFELPQAVEAFRSAIAIDPVYAAAYAGLALARCSQAQLRAVPHREAYVDARTAALRALALDSACADAQVALGIVLFLSEWDWTGAERSLRRALEISPTHTEAWLHYGSLMEALGRLDEGLQFKQQALERDPLSTLVLVQIAMSWWNLRRYDETIAWARKALEVDPRHLLAREVLAGAYLMKGDLPAFTAENLKQAEAFGAPEAAVAHVRTMCGAMNAAYEQGGPQAMARMILREALQGDDSNATVRLAVLNAAAGDRDAAFMHLDRAIASRDPSLVHLAVAPQWDGLRGDPRFALALTRMGLPTSRAGSHPVHSEDPA